MDNLIFLIQLPWFLLQWFVIIATWAILIDYVWKKISDR
jgi:hypothetical protein